MTNLLISSFLSYAVVKVHKGFALDPLPVSVPASFKAGSGWKVGPRPNSRTGCLLPKKPASARLLVSARFLQRTLKTIQSDEEERCQPWDLSVLSFPSLLAKRRSTLE